MGKNTCQCAIRTLNLDNEAHPAEHISTAPHRHAHMPGILKYRGLEAEAAEAARAIKIETLMATLQTALDDLGLSMVDLRAPETGTGKIRQG